MTRSASKKKWLPVANMRRPWILYTVLCTLLATAVVTTDAAGIDNTADEGAIPLAIGATDQANLRGADSYLMRDSPRVHARRVERKLGLTIQSATQLALRAEPTRIGAYPSVEESTILFLHVFKCAGTSLREVLITWARQEGYSGAVVEECPQMKQTEHRVCLNKHNDLMDEDKQRRLIASQKLLAGHFFWDFREYARKPYLMITTLRNPLELFVSGQQFMHREETQTLTDATVWVTNSMAARLRLADPMDIGYIRRFLSGSSPYTYSSRAKHSFEQYESMASSAVAHLNTFWVVGVVEQYYGFIEVLRRVLDPLERRPLLWPSAHAVMDNGSPVRSREVVMGIDPDLVARFNASVLGVQWQVYETALQLWDGRCREVIPHEKHESLCAVPQ